MDSWAYLKRGHWLLARDGASDASYSRSISVVEYGSRSRQFVADRRGARLGRDDAHRYDVFQRLVDRHVQIVYARARQHQKKSRGGVRRGRNVDADVLLV